MHPGNAKSLWNAVKIAKDVNVEQIPTEMYQSSRLLQNSSTYELH